MVESARDQGGVPPEGAMERSLTSVFEKHLGFPGAGRARVTAEAFVDRVVDRLHRFDEASDDLVRWVDHFFQTEHLAEDRRVEFAAFAEGREHPVLEISLGEQEFVVVDSDRDDEVVVVSGAGSMVVQRTAELVSRLRAAELPAPRQHRLGEAFRPAGERVYLVNGQGAVTALDAKAVMAAIRAAPMRAEPVARVTSAATHLPAFAAARSAPSASTVVAGGATTMGVTPRTYAAREVKALARRDSAGTGAGSVRLLERTGEVRTVSGASARVWQNLTAHVTDQGRKAEGTVAGVTAVSVGQQTFAVKAGGLTALVQRPVPKGPAPAAVEPVETRTRADRVMPAWLRELLSGAVRGHYWVDPAAGGIAATGATSAGWVTRVMEQAHAARARAKVELSGELDPAQVPAIIVRETLAAATKSGNSQSGASVIGASVIGSSIPGASVLNAAVIDASVMISSSPSVSSDSRPAPRYRLSEAGTVDPHPIGRTGALPATTLRALFTALERSAAYEGRQLRTAVVTVEPEVPIAPSSTQARANYAHAVSLIDLDTVPRHAPQLPAEMFSVVAAPGQAPVARRVPEQTSRGLFSLPFADSGTLRIGRELDVVMARAFAGGAMAPLTVPATLDTLVKVSGTPERVRIEVPDLRRARPRVVAEPGAMGVGAVDLSALGELQWSTYAARSSASEVGARAPRSRAFERDEGPSFAADGNPSTWSEVVSPEMDFAAPQAARQGPSFGASAMALGAMTPAAGLFGASDGFGLSALAGFGARAVSAPSPPLYVEPSLATSALPLAEINFRRTPLELPGGETSDPVFAHGAESGGEEPGTLRFDIPLPLHAQMSAKTLPVFARTRAAGPIGHAGVASSSFPATGAATPARSSSSPSASPVHLNAPGTAAASAAPVAKAMPALRRASRDPSPAPSAQVLVERPAQGGGAGSPPAPSSSRTSSASPSPVASRLPSGSPAAVVSGRVPSSASSSPRTEAPAVAALDAPSSRRVVTGSANFDGATADSVPTGPADGRVRPVGIGARAFEGAPSVFATPAMPHLAHEAAHVMQQPGAVARPRRRGATPLRFRYPTSARWWGESSKSAGKAMYAGRFAAAGAVVAAPSSPLTEGKRPAGVDAPSPARGARPASTNFRRAAVGAASGQAADPAFVEGSPYAGDHAAVGDRETAYVVLNADGHAQVMNARAASQVTRAKAHGAPVDMAVVAAVPPTAPTLEQMAVPGHDRPHAKAKKDQPKAGATAKSDAMSLQGTVDSLAQRIYHRLRRRLEADRERFGG